MPKPTAFQSLCSSSRCGGDHAARAPKRRSASCSAIDVGVDLAQHVEDAFGAAAAIESDPLAHVVAGDLDAFRVMQRRSAITPVRVVPVAGIEPATSSLQNCALPTELNRPRAPMRQATPKVQPSVRAIAGVRRRATRASASLGGGAQPGGGEDRVGGVVVVAGERRVRRGCRARRARRRARRRRASCCGPCAQAGGARGDRGVDLDDHRAASRAADRTARPGCGRRAGGGRACRSGSTCRPAPRRPG